MTLKLILLSSIVVLMYFDISSEESLIPRNNYTKLEEILKYQQEISYEYCQTGVKAVRMARGSLIPVPNTPVRNITEENIRFLLYTRENTYWPNALFPKDPYRVLDSLFIPTNRIVIFVDDYSTFAKRSAAVFPRAILSVADMNLLILNRDTFNFFDEFYTTNITIPRVGKILADFIKLLIENGSDPKQFYLIGFGAGAQIVSLAAKEIKPPVSRILAIDPQGNCFNQLPPTERLDKYDADFVSILYGSAGPVTLNPVSGHVTFFLNNGIYQPECIPSSLEITGEILHNIHSCSHERALAVFLDSFIRGNRYIGIRCNSTEQFQRNECDYNDTLKFGFSTPEVDEGKQYYISTAPYKSGRNLEILELI